MGEISINFPSNLKKKNSKKIQKLKISHEQVLKLLLSLTLNFKL